MLVAHMWYSKWWKYIWKYIGKTLDVINCSQQLAILVIWPIWSVGYGWKFGWAVLIWPFHFKQFQQVKLYMIYILFPGSSFIISSPSASSLIIWAPRAPANALQFPKLFFISPSIGSILLANELIVPCFCYEFSRDRETRELWIERCWCVSL